MQPTTFIRSRLCSFCHTTTRSNFHYLIKCPQLDPIRAIALGKALDVYNRVYTNGANPFKRSLLQLRRTKEQAESSWAKSTTRMTNILARIDNIPDQMKILLIKTPFSNTVFKSLKLNHFNTNTIRNDSVKTHKHLGTLPQQYAFLLQKPFRKHFNTHLVIFKCTRYGALIDAITENDVGRALHWLKNNINSCDQLHKVVSPNSHYGINAFLTLWLGFLVPEVINAEASNNERRLILG